MNLTEQAAKLTFEPKFGVMVIRAAKRLLKSRGVEAIIPEFEAEQPPELGGKLGN